MDEGKYDIIILLDLSAAFDTVVHKFLLQDLRDIVVMQEALMYLDNNIIVRPQNPNPTMFGTYRYVYLLLPVNFIQFE